MHTILVIDPDALALDGVVRALAEAGLDTLAAAGAPLGLQLARVHAPDVVLCAEACRLILLDGLRNEPTTAAIPIVVMTDEGDAASLRTGAYLGADDYLVKPFSVADLLASIDVQVRRHEALRRRTDARLDALRASISRALPHELKTPLSSILGGAQMMMLDGETMTGEEVREIARLIHESGTRLRRLVENFLSYVQIEALADGTEQASLPARMVFSHIVIERVARMQAHLCHRPADLALALEATEQPVAIAQLYFEKIIDALVDNAFKFSEDGTPVHVFSYLTTEGLHVGVRDAGRGMDLRQAARLGAYVQLDRPVYEQQGAGLGLYLVQQLVDLHGGRLWLESTPGVGTTVEVVLPLVTPAWAGGPRPPETQAA